MKFRDLIYLNKSDRNSLIILIAGVIIVLSLLFYLNKTGQTDKQTLSQDSTNMPYPQKKEYMSKGGGQRYIDNTPIACEDPGNLVLRPFDPNTADSTTLLGLGLSRWQVRNIYKYRAHGGVYKKKSDFAKLYGLTVKQYRTIEPYIVISDEYTREASTLFSKEERDTIKYPVKIKAGQHVSLNIADTTQLKKVPGIGSGYAKAIISYGKRLGGYVDKNQLLEIEGFPEESLSYFSVAQCNVSKININKASISRMRKHPYITFFMARTISDYRRINGPIKDISELKLSKDFTPENIKRLRSYIEY